MTAAPGSAPTVPSRAIGAVTIAEHCHRVDNLLAPLRSTHRVPIRDALGAVLAADVQAINELPAFANSAVDGFAVRARDVEAASRGTPVTLTVATYLPAGVTDARSLAPGTAAQIMTGAPIPNGADTVIAVEDTTGFVRDRAYPLVSVFVSMALGANIRARGEDIGRHACVARAGTEVTPALIGALGALGLASIEVFRRLTVAILTTGAELVAPGTPLGFGRIHESNSAMLEALVRGTGAEVVSVQTVGDDTASFRRDLIDAANGCDVVITSGGVSAGTHEVVREATTGEGVTFGPVLVRPGKPQGLGTFHGTPLIALPGNPVSSFVSFEVFVRSGLRVAMGHRTAGRVVRTVTVTEAIPGRGSVRQFLLGLTSDGSVTPLDAHAPIAALAASNCLIDVNSDSGIERGAAVHTWSLE
ncbi:hypothetical protein CH306_26100 [Rhodococcus sp. 15-725-2-2b]|uniref:molybdopterin molybdotransferase MoeA n=1 Tax=unclassified Rhodococcus (in: high G+C Gram-positive bacteria) TaxID=192944 RepID=UPI000B9B5539|nr:MULTISPECIES: gephyrin-like molybdotransferase Glp [unclassified Rhodococcus (in: high G+C Gram-positive bacteria)]OZC63629.1 hypothetical protein CH277_22560 [Rhodococcus sp. 06-469-3-2]OZD40794.1 hypothetical protein CH264_24245 [Rhodococcus sp. 06-1477-1A]OZE67098.1 hypothetical protein CH306_26100 [Rhodococcus sp. 15-725-2-2b]